MGGYVSATPLPDGSLQLGLNPKFENASFWEASDEDVFAPWTRGSVRSKHGSTTGREDQVKSKSRYSPRPAHSWDASESVTALYWAPQNATARTLSALNRWSWIAGYNTVLARRAHMPTFLRVTQVRKEDMNKWFTR